MPGRSGVENDVIEFREDVVVREQSRELVEGRDFGRAGSRQLLLHPADLLFRQHTTYRADDAVAVRLRSGLRVDLQSREAGNGVDGCEVIADAETKHLTDIRSGIGADEQNTFALLGQ